ncbi:MAG: acetate--CoA ligase family protein [Methanosarcinales archaeon]|nr:acetate--CoA ligase family protein [Methanosarcinales archaeon]
MNLTTDQLHDILMEYGIPLVQKIMAASLQEAVEAANKLHYPVVMKISSPDISHKTDVGGILLDLNSDEEIKKAYLAMMDSVKKNIPEARIDGVIIQKMAKSGLEVIVGAKLDPQFGHVIMFGLGGIFVEIYKDVSFRVTPIDQKTAHDMILEIKASSIIQGARGQEPADIDAIIKVITGLSRMLEKKPGIIELDINPLIVYSHGAVAVDARMLTH